MLLSTKTDFYQSFLTLKTSSSSSRSSSMLFQLSLGTLITFSTVPLSEMGFFTHRIIMLFKYWIKLRVKIENKSFTCANKHDIVLSVGSADSVHSNLCEAVVHVSSDEDGPSAHRVDWVIHQRVVTCKLNYIIWETLCGLKTAECLAGTLIEGNREKFS